MTFTRGVVNVIGFEEYNQLGVLPAHAGIIFFVDIY